MRTFQRFKVHKQRYFSVTTNQDDEHFDIAIVGAGMAGIIQFLY
jgi:hypothetical protein